MKKMLWVLLLSLAALGRAEKAPEFPGGMTWLNTGGKNLSLRQLRGKVVLVDFWTYACINCQHILPDLKRLEKKYGDALAVVGVHSAKFATEKGNDAIRQAILRNGLTHPVVNDSDFKVWQAYDVHAWPTLILIDASGNLAARHEGEQIFEALDGPIHDLVQEAEASGKLKKGPLAFESEEARLPGTPLAFPGKVLAAVGEIFISDSGHHRLVVASQDGTVLSVVGTGKAGRADGPYAEASFNNPQGLALAGTNLFVADTGNHLIRLVNLQTEMVRTVAGTGAMGGPLDSSGQGLKVPLNSPWDLALAGNRLYIAMAGAHQIWQFGPGDGFLAPFAGTGEEGIHDALRERAEMAQPSGLTTDGDKLYSADAESSAIRQMDFSPQGMVESLVGTGLFDFGDKDGRGKEALFQHPLGVAAGKGKLYVADTLNHRIKILDLKTLEVRSWLGDGKAGYEDGGPGQLNEPGGLSLAGGKLYVADTNNGVIRVADLGGSRLETLKLKNLKKLSVGMGPEKEPASQAAAPRSLADGISSLRLDLDLPPRHHLNRDAPNLVEVKAGGSVESLEGKKAWHLDDPVFPLDLKLKGQTGKGSLEIEATLYYCENGREGRCLIKMKKIRVPLEISGGGPKSASVTISLK
jgi:thiol-disulfide isomerase/thioredoxin